MRILVSYVLSSCAVLVSCSPQVQLHRTTLVGRDVAGLKQDFFGGIPYAEPPLGPLRLRPPVFKPQLDPGSFNASNFGLSCLQPVNVLPSYVHGMSSDLISEDCLTINVFRPSGVTENSSLPVLFWTYGGGFESGSASLFNGSAIVAQSVVRGTPIIYVNFNYRLGPLGFPQGAEAASRGILNLAIKDQLAALEWVQSNIGAFGGDKHKVTVFGESAGSIMTSILFLHPSISKFARAAIFESGSATSSITFNAQRREDSWTVFVQSIPSCSSFVGTSSTVNCLQSVSSSDILEGLLRAFAEANEAIPYDPTLDGASGVFPGLPSELFPRGQFARLPFIAGTNLDEGTMFCPTELNYTNGLLRQILNANFSPPAVPDSVLDEILALYPDDPSAGSPYNTGNETFGLSPLFKKCAALTGDLNFDSQRRHWIQTTSESGVKAFGYRFTQPPSIIVPDLGVYHGSELPFVYGALGSPNEPASANALSVAMIDYWVSFATSLDPNDGRGSSRPIWPQYTPERQVLIQLNGNNLTVIPDDYNKDKIDFIISEGATFRHRR
ncbi:extracellular triacylglycerol lipase precursor [Desarmillaria tabescens]|uniref:Carboxylic ester hydrolase n=1 Tax=Armillaria tabescens TaxID=1929756 RepID=A0AA39N7Y2_ARMTA|nr:extracellular triacylglycerol lipase precursor [Desarmillaria tabescens]KAK0460687.1 extracellular triacylglycerol lipase precursor [Desarmillaria tabescens]